MKGFFPDQITFCGEIGLSETESIILRACLFLFFLRQSAVVCKAVGGKKVLFCLVLLVPLTGWKQ